MNLEGGDFRDLSLERLQSPGLCVLATVYSMLCEQYGRPFELPQHLIDFRSNQISSDEASIQYHREEFNRRSANLNGVAWEQKQEEFEQHLDLVTSRLDAMQIRELVSRIAADQSDLGRAVRDCQVDYESGRFSNARYWISQGYSVGILTAWATLGAVVPHMFHLGIDESGQFADLSDIGADQSLNSFRVQFYEHAMISRIRRPGDWNMLMIRKTY